MACRFPVEEGHSAMRGDSGRSELRLGSFSQSTSVGLGNAAGWPSRPLRQIGPPRDFVRTTLGPRKVSEMFLQVRTSKSAQLRNTPAFIAIALG
jgi:hypothetical protein